MFETITSIASIIIGGIFFGREEEKKAYNNGICPKCSTKLRHFDTDSQGGRGYCCNNCGYTTWCSYDVDR